MEAKTYKNLPRWAIDWDAVNYKWTKQFKEEIIKLDGIPKTVVDSLPIVLNIDSIEHLIKMTLERKRFPKQSMFDTLTVCFMTKSNPRLSEPKCCIKYIFYPVAKRSVLSDLLHSARAGKDTFSKDDCSWDEKIPYGDYAMRIIDQLNVVLGVKFCELFNAFLMNKSHLLRFRCTYYNKFGYYGRGGSLYSSDSEYSEISILRDIDIYNIVLLKWSSSDKLNPINNVLSDMRADFDYTTCIKPYGDNLVRFIPADTLISPFKAAKFEVYANPNGANSIIDRIADTIGALFIQPVVIHAPLTNPLQLSQLETCTECFYLTPIDLKYCEYCSAELATQKRHECKHCNFMNTMDARICAFCYIPL